MPAMDGQIDQGLAFLKGEDFKKALRAFKKAISQCGCQEDARALALRLQLPPSQFLESVMPSRCQCKDWLAALHDANSYSLYGLATKPCSCGSGRKKCSHGDHIRALEGCCAVLEAAGKLAEALELAAAIIDMAPARAEVFSFDKPWALGT